MELDSKRQNLEGNVILELLAMTVILGNHPLHPEKVRVVKVPRGSRMRMDIQVLVSVERLSTRSATRC